jgi:hypothetical protein
LEDGIISVVFVLDGYSQLINANRIVIIANSKIVLIILAPFQEELCTPIQLNIYTKLSDKWIKINRGFPDAVSILLISILVDFAFILQILYNAGDKSELIIMRRL